MLTSIEGGAWNADHLVLISQLVGKCIVFCSLVPVLVGEVLLHYFHFSDVHKDEVTSLWNPETKIIRGLEKLFDQEISEVFHLGGKFFEVCVSRLSNGFHTLGSCIFNGIVEAEDIVLMN